MRQECLNALPAGESSVFHSLIAMGKGELTSRAIPTGHESYAFDISAAMRRLMQLQEAMRHLQLEVLLIPSLRIPPALCFVFPYFPLRLCIPFLRILSLSVLNCQNKNVNYVNIL
ncbi:hypothetical protein CEXT_797831 [Caerostris extrusa]|uniref:Uncharacterized protein n=1 Tax=Caerostris extrusa TaxID=172846 RepID=A0AAV4PRW5_CAEEX|nr:hypothetical protein CEXT_797831 [Caerostris extrusa]